MKKSAGCFATLPVNKDAKIDYIYIAEDVMLAINDIAVNRGAGRDGFPTVHLKSCK